MSSEPPEKKAQPRRQRHCRGIALAIAAVSRRVLDPVLDFEPRDQFREALPRHAEFLRRARPMSAGAHERRADERSIERASRRLQPEGRRRLRARRTAAAAPRAARRRAWGIARRATASTFCSSRMLPGQSYAPVRPASQTPASRGCRPARSLRARSAPPAPDVVATVAQRRQRDADDVEPIQQVGRNRPAAASARRSRLVAVTRRTSTRRRDVLPDPPDLALLNRAQQLGLCARRQLADFVEEQCARMRLLEHARAVRQPRR